MFTVWCSMGHTLFLAYKVFETQGPGKAARHIEVFYRHK